jgi:uncharacterized membrane protein
MNLPGLPVNLLLVLAVVLSAAAVIGLLLKSGANLIPRRIHRIVSGLRILGLIALLLALLNPYWTRSAPDPTAYRVAVLADVSRSMETRDLPDGSSRLDWLSTWLNPSSGQPGFREVVDELTPVGIRLFSKESLPWEASAEIETAPGQTAIGEALASLHEEATARSGNQLGGVLLLSDGISLSGLAPADAAKKFKQAGIPVSVIGIGASTATGDVRVEFSENVKRLQEGEKTEIQIELENSYSVPRSGQLSVYQNKRILAQRGVSIEAEGRITEIVPIEGTAPGVNTLQAEFVPDYVGDNEATNTSFSIAEIQARDHYQFLLLTARGGWSERMLRVLANENTSFTIDSLVRIDAERFFLNQHPSGQESSETTPIQRETLDEIPSDAEFYRPYDALILDDSFLLEDPETMDSNLREFVGTKGGGILLIHSGGTVREPGLPASLRNLFPARDISPSTLPTRANLRFDGTGIFADFLGSVLFADPPATIPAMSSFGIANELSRAAEVSVVTTPGDQPLLVSHAYGAGRAAWLASDSVWRWKLESKRGETQYNEFWEAVLSWLAVGGKDRLVAPINASIASIDEPVDLGINLLGRDYAPRMDASVSALLTGPDGQAKSIRLVPDIDQPGHYTHHELLDQAGTWQIDYAVLFPDGDELQETAWFAMAAISPESQQTAFQEKTLRDIARITGGVYHPYREWSPRSGFPLSAKIPKVEERIHWARSWPFLLVTFGFFAIEWWLRRRHGLR